MTKEFEDEKRKHYPLSDNVYAAVTRHRDSSVLKGVTIPRYVDRIASGVYDFIRVPLSDQLFEVMYQMMYVL